MTKKHIWQNGGVTIANAGENINVVGAKVTTSKDENINANGAKPILIMLGNGITRTENVAENLKTNAEHRNEVKT